MSTMNTQEARPPIWNKVWGWLCIVWGVITLLMACCGTISVLMVTQLGKMAGMDFPPAPGAMRVWMVIALALSLLFAVALVMGGVNLLRQRKAARSVLMFYCAASLIMLPVDWAAGAYLMQPMATWNREIAAATNDFMRKNNQKPTPEMEAAAREEKVTGGMYFQMYGMPTVLSIFPGLLMYFLVTRKQQMQNWPN